MATYKVQNDQNLFDVAIYLYGTIEGLYDLLISNPTINMAEDLRPGTELEYHESFVINSGIASKLQEDNAVVNNERVVYHKDIEEDLVAVIKVPANLDIAQFSISGDGVMSVDWGDNSSIEKIELTTHQSLVSHYFDNTVDERRIRIFGNFNIIRLDISRLAGDLYLTKPIVIDEFVCHSNDNLLSSLFLFKDTYLIDLEGMVVNDLSPIYDMSLSNLNLMGVQFQNPDILNDYLVYVRQNYGARRACKVYLNTTPSQEGLKAINEILSEEEWNTPDAWEFHINGKLYTIDNGADIN